MLFIIIIAIVASTILFRRTHIITNFFLTFLEVFFEERKKNEGKK